MYVTGATSGGNPVYSVKKSVTMNCSERDRLRPPGRISAITEKGVNEPIAKLTGTRQVVAKFLDRLCPIIRPQTGPVVDCGFRSALDSPESQGR
jgi:hypothetical protein